MEQKKKWDLFALSSIPLVMTLGNSMLIPVLPTMEKKLGISGFQSSMIITVYSLVAILLIPIAGIYLTGSAEKKLLSQVSSSPGLEGLFQAGLHG